MIYGIECVLDCANHLGEGPVWDVAEQCLYWVDSTGRRVDKPAIWRFDPATGDVRNWNVSADIGAMALRSTGGAVLALNDGFYSFDFDSGATELIAATSDDSTRARLNDGKVDRHGRFIVGGMDDQEELEMCSLWRLDPDHSVTKLEDGIICSNGPCWSPDSKTFYFIDTFKKEIWAYDYDLSVGTIANRRVFTSLADEPGFADGSTVDAEGYLWNAQVIGGDLIRYAPDGSVDLRLAMPVKNITSVMFGGPDLDEIYVTSMARVAHPAAHKHFSAEAKPQFTAGGLFRITGLGIKGLEEPRFAG